MANVHRHGFTRLSGGDGNDDQCSLNILFIHGFEDILEEWRRDRKAQGLQVLVQATNSWVSINEHRTSASLLHHLLLVVTATVQRLLARGVPRVGCTSGPGVDVQIRRRCYWGPLPGEQQEQHLPAWPGSKPIAFVVHSLGGIIVKDAVRRSEIVRDQTKLIIFLGTPHRGSAYAGWGQIASNLARLALQGSNKKLLETLEVNNEVLDNIHEEFKTIAFKGAFKIHSFQEARGIAGIKGLDEKVVDDFSSKLDLPRALETVESINANHMQMARTRSLAAVADFVPSSTS
ncbi:uncharacterized protein BDR25DRAFT_26099 [Lindgomyces ingoldianus]|uniref:Uncharacterized protein n=1 Tax=Lindgomyces ingoldianus TaxID=673940 RepID=A0ACB6QWF4_9PLEO|nr:uncharacterized protein BDR25DRAFT_26099 [Lindgomyces ingoldianus]KAF2471354.1 hypothetical protein BDR25DRAFT_26099 [Lindgomyces ingoldianus]